jgi:signal transduction histidine kinase
MGVPGEYAERVDHHSTVPSVHFRDDPSSVGAHPTEPDHMAWTAHEVRAPLLAVRSALERVLSRTRGLDESERVLLRRSVEELSRLSSSIESLLSLSVRPLVLRPERANLVRLVREAVASSTLRAGSERVWVKGPTTVPIIADAARLRAAIGNVIRNGLAYSPAGTNVIVDIGVEEGSACVSVRDSGPGIDSAEHEEIFLPYVRGRAGSSGEGLGVGLALTKQIVEAHGGTIALRSGPSGSVFEIRLPRKDGTR